MSLMGCRRRPEGLCPRTGAMELPPLEIGRPQEGHVQDVSLNQKLSVCLSVCLSLFDSVCECECLSLSSFVSYPSAVENLDCVMYTGFHSMGFAVCVSCHLTSTPPPVFSRSWQVGL